MKPTVGRIVLYSFRSPSSIAIERPAIVVETHPDTFDCVDLQVFTNANEDDDLLEAHERSGRDARGRARSVVWRTKVPAAADMREPQSGCWRWPPRVS